MCWKVVTKRFTGVLMNGTKIRKTGWATAIRWIIPATLWASRGSVKVALRACKRASSRMALPLSSKLFLM